MRLGDGEPDLGPWQSWPEAAVAAEVLRLARAGRQGSGRAGPLVVAVDGRGAGGKSHLSEVLAARIPGAVVVHSDDIAWYHSFFAWNDLLVEGVLDPLGRGQAVGYRPPAWDERGREGSIAVAADCPLVLVEGVGVSRLALRPRLDAAVWVQSDLTEAKRRGVDRDVAGGRERDEVESFWDEWMQEELPFLAADRPWERADLVVCGTPGVLTVPSGSEVEDDDALRRGLDRSGDGEVAGVVQVGVARQG